MECRWCTTRAADGHRGAGARPRSRGAPATKSHRRRRDAVRSWPPLSRWNADGARLGRLMDIAARELGLDPAELRRRNLIAAAEMPYDRGLLYRDGMPMVHDSGDYPALLAKALEGAGYATFRARQAAARRQGWLLGIGIAAYNEATGIGPHEGATVGVESDGRVRVTVGAPCQGQGHETTLAQVCADRLGVSLECVAVSGGDTARFPVSAGTYASRVAVIVGNAVAQAADVVRDKARHVAARALECDPEDVVIADG